MKNILKIVLFASTQCCTSGFSSLLSGKPSGPPASPFLGDGSVKSCVFEPSDCDIPFFACFEEIEGEELEEIEGEEPGPQVLIRVTKIPDSGQYLVTFYNGSDPYSVVIHAFDALSSVRGAYFSSIARKTGRISLLLSPRAFCKFKRL